MAEIRDTLGEPWDELARQTDRLRTARLEPMPVAEIRQLMRAPTIEPRGGEEREGRIALHVWRLRQASERGHAAGLALGSLFLRGRDQA